MSASKESARGAVPDARRAPREFLEHLYRVAVERALPLASMGAHLPPRSGSSTTDHQRAAGRPARNRVVLGPGRVADEHLDTFADVR